jgi:DNA modification methylase
MDGLRTIPDGCVQCTVTSPPYYGLRDYGVDGQIGLEENPDQYIQKMVEVFREVRRVTRDDGVLWLNLGDSYSGSMSTKGAVVNQNSMSAGTGQDVGYREKPLGIVEGYKAKDLMGIPWRVAFALQADGWYFRSAMPWIKRNCMPESTTDRPTSAIEHVFLMAKSAKYFYDGEAIRCPAAYSIDERKERARTNQKSMPTKEKNGIRPKKQDQTGNPTYTGFNGRWAAGKGNRKSFRGGGKYTNNQSFDNSKPVENETHDNHPNESMTRNYRNSDPFFESWQGLYQEQGDPLALIINPQARPELHFASFPDLLAETCIKAGTSEYGCCPKCGAPWGREIEVSGGTTGKSWHPQNDRRRTGKICGINYAKEYTRKFKGWQPGCKCGENERVPCMVLDPFMGSGTVAVVARVLNRSSIGCEISPEYVKIIRNRLQVDSQLDTGIHKYHFEVIGNIH